MLLVDAHEWMAFFGKNWVALRGCSNERNGSFTRTTFGMHEKLEHGSLSGDFSIRLALKFVKAEVN